MFIMGLYFKWLSAATTLGFIWVVKNLKNSLKEKTFFKDLRKEVETGANGTQDYVVKKGANKDTIATTKQ